jgi:spore coat protein U-like protein
MAGFRVHGAEHTAVSMAVDGQLPYVHLATLQTTSFNFSLQAVQATLQASAVTNRAPSHCKWPPPAAYQLYKHAARILCVSNIVHCLYLQAVRATSAGLS